MSRRFTHSQPTRSLFQPKLLVFCSVILLGFFLFGQQQENHQLDFEDALFLTKNSIKEFKEQYLPKGIHVKKDNQTANTSTTLFSLDLDYPLNSVVNSFFPIDSTIAFNTTAADGENITTSEITGRYASFSPILNYRLRSKYRIFPNDACDKIDSHDKQYHDYKDKILIVLRGECTFVDKVSNVLDSGLNPASVIIANDEPYRSLVTMFSPNFNQDGSLRIPIMFITNEDYRVLKEFSSEDITLEVTTASIGSWFSIIVSMILSPPLLIIFFYSIIICGQRVRRHQVNIRNARLVRELPVYIYNGNHLINAKFFNQYLKITGQTVKPIDTTTESNTHSDPKDSQPLFEDISGEQNSQSKDNDSPKQSPSSSYSSLNRIIVNGIDIRTSAASLHLLTAPENFYPAYKCSICLEKYTPLRSKVLVLDCKHIYHEKCLSNWLINFRRSCPLCNIMINPRNDSYLLAGQDTSSSDYGSMTEEDLEAQRPIIHSRSDSVAQLEFITDSPSQDESEEDDDLYSNSQDLPSAGNSSQDFSTVDGELGATKPGLRNERASFVSRLSDSTFLSSTSKESSVFKPNTSSGGNPRKYLYSRPSQILSRLSSKSEQDDGNSVGMSVSIDSGDFVTAKTTIPDVDHQGMNGKSASVDKGNNDQ